MKKLLFVILVFTTLSSIQAVNANLTDEEREWLAKHQTIRIAPDPEFPPIEWFDENGIYQGIAAEFMDLISRELGIEFESVRCNNWDEVLQKARDREVDMLPAAAQTPQRAEYMDFSPPHLIFPGVIITRNNFPGIKTTEQLHGKKVVIVSGYVWQDFLSIHHPDIDIIPVKTLLDGLRDVSTGVQDVMIATLPIALYYIEQEGILNLRVSGETGYFTKLSILTRKDWPILGTITQKTLSNIPANKKNKIIKKWITLKRKSIFSNKQFWIILISILIFSLIGFIIIFLFNRILKHQVVKQTALLNSSEEKYRSIFEATGTATLIVDEDTNIIHANKECERVTGNIASELVGKSWTEFVYKEDLLTMLKRSKARIKEPGSVPKKYEVRLINAKGEIRNAILSIEIMNDSKRSIVSMIDITERKQAEKEIMEKSKQLTKQFEKSEKQRIANTIILQDLNKTTRELKDEIIEHNKADKALKERMNELEIFNNVTVDRELKINELRKEINELLMKLGREEKYKIVT
ncbi:MAG: transporter substrate-binding domain-containing protein [Candidatus Cloacimonetes bacterium]|jgi:PAS domain S-box-containing protein|nr:transporter substrate-binding domain-containing protein [Candidatus Cloacimonadota bacterium]